MCQTSAIPTSEAGSESAAATTPAARRQELEDAAFGPPNELWAMAVEIAALRGCRPGVLPPGKLYWECGLDEAHALRVDTRERTCSVWCITEDGARRRRRHAALPRSEREVSNPGVTWVMAAWLEAQTAEPYRGVGLEDVAHVLQTALESARLEMVLVRVSLAEVSS